MLKVHCKKPIRMDETRHILVRGTNWIGDVVMTFPALHAIRLTFPKAHIAVLVKPWVADLLEACPDIDEVIRYEKPGRHKGIGGILRLAGELKAHRFDCVILLQNAIEAAIIAWLARIPIRAGYNSDARGWLLTHSVQRTQAIRKIHQTGYYVEMLNALGFQAADLTIHLQLPDAYVTLTDQLFKKFRIDREKPLVGMAPGAAYGPAKRWPAERFAQVATELVRTYGGNVILLGSRSDRTVTNIIAQGQEERVLNLAGDTSLKEAMALIARCALFISNDSGLMHVAGALGVPTLAIFGSTNPITTSPPGKQCRIIRRALPCSPCLKKECTTGFQCMTAITAEEVFETAREMIESEKAGGRNDET